MAENTLTYEIVADTKKAEKSTKDLEKKSTKAFKKLGKTIGSSLGTMAKLNLAFEGAGRVLAGLNKISDKFIKTQKTMARAKFFGAHTREAKAFAKVMGNTLSKLEALAQVTEMKSLGFTQKDILRAGKMARAMSIVNNLTREGALAAIQSGDMNSKMAEQFNMHANVFEDAIKKRERALGAELTTLDKSRIMMNLIEGAIKRSSESLDTMARKDIVSPFKKLKVLFQNIVDALVVKLVPKFRTFIKSMGGFDKLSNKILKVWTRWLGIIDKAVQLFKDIAAGRKTITGILVKDVMGGIGRAMGKIFQVPGLQKPISQVGKTGGPSQRFMGVQMMSKEESKKSMNSFSKSMQAILKNVMKSNQTGQGFAFRTGDVSKRDMRGPLRRKTKSQQERLEEQIANESEARSMLRNFLPNYLDAVSSLGGTVSGVIASMKDLPEKLKILIAEPGVQHQLVEILGTSNVLAILNEKDLKNTTKLIMELGKRGKLNEKGVKAMMLLAIHSKNGLNDQVEFLANLKTETKVMKKNLSILTSASRLGELATMRKDAMVDGAIALRDIELARNGVMQKQLKLQGLIDKANDTNRGKLVLQEGIWNQKLKRLTKWRDDYKKGLKDRLGAIKLTENQIKLQMKLETIRQKTGIKRQTKGVQNQLTTSQIALGELRGKDMSQAKIVFENTKKRQEIENKIVDLGTRKLTLEENVSRARGLGDARSLGIAKYKLKLLKTQLDIMTKMLGVEKSTGEEKLKQNQRQQGFMGGMRAQFQSQIEQAKAWSKDSSKVMGQAFGQVLNSVVQTGMGAFEALGGFMVEAFAGKGDAFGDFGRNTLKAILSFIGDTALQFSALFGAIALGAQFVPGMQVNAGGMFAAAAGLALLAGATKAGASLIGEKSASNPAGGGVGTASTGSTSIGMGGEKLQSRNTQEVFVVVNSMPWQGSEQQQARRFRDFLKRNRRTIGGTI